MPSVTTWVRLEPRARTDDMRPSLEGHLFDPAWLLARQWQVGEFVGVDGGSPIFAELEVSVSPLAAYRAGSGPPVACGQMPLDALAGPEPSGAWTLADSAEAGAQLLSFLTVYGCSAAGLTALVTAHPLPAAAEGTADPQGMAFLKLLAGRLPHAVDLEPLARRAIRVGQVPPAVGIPSGDDTAFLAAAHDWIAWLDALTIRVPPAGDAWVDSSLDHQFTLGVSKKAGSSIAMVAPAWDGERIDWYDLDADLNAAAPTYPGPLPPLPGVDPATGIVRVSGPPAPLTYPGMPPPRWWQFDEGHVNFAQVTAGKDDLARMLVVEFATIYSNAWYLWPLRLPVGALHSVQSLNVTTTFSDVRSIGPVGTPGGTSSGQFTPEGDWCLFRSSVRGQPVPSALNGLLLLPALTEEQRSSPLELVMFMRDEVAEIAWGIEQTIVGSDGRPLDRHAAAFANPFPGPPEVAAASSDYTPLQYQLQTEVPLFWFPLVPDAGGAAMFDRVVVPRMGSDGQMHDVQPAGVVLRPGQSLAIRQEEVPREGAEVLRHYHHVRGVDGSVLLWSAKTKRAGRGEGTSGLRYDLAKG